MRFQKLMWRNIMKSTKSQKVSVLHYSIDVGCYNFKIANPNAGCREVIISRKSECQTTGIGGTKNTDKIK